MNTPDYSPKDGDFVAYLAELERQQLRAHAPAPMGNATKGAPTAGRPLSTPMAPPAALGTAQRPPVPTAGAIANPLDLVRAMPVGLMMVGVVLVIAGLGFKGGFILIMIGLVMLASAVRQALKSIGAPPASHGTTPAQQVTALLKAAAQQKSGSKK